MNETAGEKEVWIDEQQVEKDIEFLLRAATKGLPLDLLVPAILLQCDSMAEIRKAIGLKASIVIGKMMREGLIEERHGRYYPVSKERKK